MAAPVYIEELLHSVASDVRATLGGELGPQTPEELVDEVFAFGDMLVSALDEKTACGVHPARPLLCRGYNSCDRDDCLVAFEAGTDAVLAALEDGDATGGWLRARRSSRGTRPWSVVQSRASGKRSSLARRRGFLGISCRRAAADGRTKKVQTL